MRLIDADAMKQHYPIMENDFGMVFNEGLHKELDKEPTVRAIPIERLEQIRNEIEQEYNKFRNMSDKWDERACGLGTALEIIDKAIKEAADGEEDPEA